MLIERTKYNMEEWLKKTLIFGVFTTLAGLLLVPKISNYQTFYYISVLAPVLLISAIRPKEIIKNTSNIAKIFIIFSAWSVLSVLWSDTQESMLTPIKRTIYILCLFISFSIINTKSTNTILKIFICAGAVVALISAYHLFLFQMTHQPNTRFIGTGALSNPLLSSHIFGLFSVLFLTLSLTTKAIKINFIYFIIGLILILTVVATGSRTPLLALVSVAIWIAFILKNKKSISIIFFTIAALTFIYLLHPDAILSRGVSYRPELWSAAVEKILLRPILGYGFDSNAGFYISALDTTFREPHNIHLSIFYFTGAIGFTLWCAMHVYALLICWKNKTNTLFIIASALLVYGIVAGMTEGGGLLPRPKEHWFITWIPLAFVSALLTHKNSNAKTTKSADQRI